ncbi:MAG: hypothetical protein GEU97_07420 [Actinophytocola sp.]|nr:hypothetical protein [Actinophytocola sp.]
MIHLVSDSGAVPDTDAAPVNYPHDAVAIPGCPDHDVRFSVPLFTATEAARYLDVPSSTFASWVKGRQRDVPPRTITDGAPVVTGLAPELHGGPSIPFGGLAEALFLSALRSMGMWLRQVRPALDMLCDRMAVAHPLASRELLVAGPDLLADIGRSDTLDEAARRGARDLIVLRGDQYVFRDGIDRFLQRIEYDDGYASRLHLPRYEVAAIATDTDTNFGRPYFDSNGTPLEVVKGLLKAGATVDAVANDFNLPVDQVTDVAQRDSLLAP